MMTRLSFRSINILHRPLLPVTVPHLPSSPSTIGRLTANAHRGLSSTVTAATNSAVAAMSRRDLSKELEDGIQPWTGPSVFSTSISIPPRNVKVGPGEGGRSTSPISISSSSSAESSPVRLPNPGGRLKGVARYASPLPRTAYTPPKANFDQSQTQTQGTIHPFFSRARSLSPRVPSSQRPRMVAHYSSTESSQSQSQSQSQGTQDSQSTFGEPSSSAADRFTKPSAKGKERATTGPPSGWSEQDVEDMASQFGNVQIAREPLKSIPMGSRHPAPEFRVPAKATASSSTTTHRAPPQPLAKKPIPAKPKSKVSINYPTTRPQDVPSPETVWFQHALCPNPPSIAYTTDASEANDLISSLKGDVFGFDLEWPPAGRKTVALNALGKEVVLWPGRKWDVAANKFVFKTGKTAMIQICDKHLVILIHMTDMKDLPEKVIELVQDPKRIKLGVQIGGDGTKLLKDYAPHLTRATSLLELTHLARRVDGEAIGPGNTLISLAKLTERYTGYPLRKEKDVRSGDWAAAVNTEQKDYAANDVYASLLIYEKLVSLAKKRDINIHPLRQFCSDKGDYRPSSPKSPKEGTHADVIFAKRDAVTPSPTPSEARTIGMFVEGKNTEQIALEMGIKHSTAQTYLASGVGKIHEDVLSKEGKKRFLADVQDNIWVQRRHEAVLTRIRGDLGEKPRAEVTDLSNETESAPEEEEEAVEEIERI